MREDGWLRRAYSVKRSRSLGLLLLSVFLSSTALWYLVELPVIGDDLVFVTYGGVGELWAGVSIPEFTWFWITESVGSNHVTPVNGLLNAGQLITVSWLAQLGIDIPTSWGVFRLFWIQLALVSLTYALVAWLSFVRPSIPRGVRMFVAIYALSAVGLIAFLQIHAPAGYDPILSYSTAGWVTVIFVFLSLAMVAHLWNPRCQRKGLVTLALIIFGVLGVLNYEMMVAGLVAIGVTSIVLFFFSPYRTKKWQNLFLSLIASGVPLIVFVITQWVRTLWPTWYDGTSTGFVSLILPVTATGLVSLLPLTNSQLLATAGWTLGTNMGQLLLSFVAFTGLIWIAWHLISSMRRSNSRDLEGGKYFGLLIALISFLGTATVISTLIFAVSAKYQVDPGMVIGRTYINYAVGLMSLVALVSIILFFLILNRNWKLFTFTLIIFTSVFIAQNTLNLQLLGLLKQSQPWNIPLLQSLGAKEVSEQERCNLLLDLNQSDFSDRQKTAIAVGLENAFFGNWGKQYCEALTVELVAPQSLALNQ